MKKSYLLVLGLAALLSVSACSETSSSPSPSSEEPSETTSQVEPSQEPSSADPTSEEEPSSGEPSSEEPSSVEPSSEEPSSVAQDYAINVDAPNTVTVEVAEQATEGTTVSFTVTVNDPSKTELVSVKVNGFTLQPEGNSYSFEMPAEAANIVVETAAITYTVTNSSSDYCYLVGLNDDYSVGDLVSFSVGLKPGYHYYGLDVYTIGEDETQNPVEYTQLGNSYSFTMPEENVFVKLETEATPYKLNYSVTGSVTSIDYNFYNVADGSRISNNSYVPAGTEMKVEFKLYSSSDGKHKVNKVSFDGKELTPNAEDGYYYVTMPSYPASFAVETVAVTRAFNITPSEHLSAFITSDKEGTVDSALTEGTYDTKYYLHVSSNDAAYSVNSVNISYTDEEGTVQSITVKEETTGSLYSFTCPKGDVTITFVEKDLSMYLNHEVVGSYIGYNLFSTSTANKTSITSPTEMKFNGDATSSGWKSGAWTIVDNNHVSVSDKVFTHEGNSLFAQYGSANSDVYVFVKGVKGSDVLTNDACYSKDNNTINWYANLTVNGETTTSFACINDVVYLNVTITLLEGTTINGASKFEVSKNGKLLATVTNAGSNKLTVEESNVTTTYTGEKGDLVVGNKSATFEGAEYSYTLEGTTLTLTSPTKTYVLELDVTALTYTVTSFEEKENNVFGGYTFEGTYDDYYWDEYEPTQSSLKIVFNVGPEITGTLYVGGTNYYFEFTATLEGNTLTMTIGNNISGSGLVGKVITATVDGQSIAINNDISTTYTTRYGVATCASFPGLSE